MRKKTFFEAVIIPAVILAALGVAAWFFIAQPAAKFDGERITSADPARFYLRFNVLNTEEAETLSLREGDSLRVSWLIESGSIDLSIAMAGQEPIYQANGRGNGDAAAFDLTVPQSGNYIIAVTGRKAKGWINVTTEQQ